MIRVNIFKITKYCDYECRQVECNKHFKSIETAHKFCTAPKLYGKGQYAFILIQKTNQHANNCTNYCSTCD